MLVYLLAMVASAATPADTYLDVFGGAGGGRFEAHCPAGQVLTGFDLRAGDDVDAIRPLCAVARGPRDVGPASAESTWYGGNGGGPARVECNQYSPVINGVYLAAEGQDTVIINNIHLFCGEATNTEPPRDAATAVFDAPKIDGKRGIFQVFSIADSRTQRCPPGKVAVGVHGRSGIWLDAIGLICGASGVSTPPLDPNKSLVTAIGRKNTGAPSSPSPRRSICDAARDARARQSPAAANLEAQCQAWKNANTSTTMTQGSTSSLLPSPPLPAAGPAYLYSVDAQGNLRWFKHLGTQAGTRELLGPKVVGSNWRNLKAVFAGGDGVIYTISQGGTLMRTRHAGFATGLASNQSGSWEPPQKIADGWGRFTQAFSVGHGVIYGVMPDGTLKWYRLQGVKNGQAVIDGPRDVGSGWNGLKIFSVGDGVIYTITPDGTLRWYRHNAYLTGEGPKSPNAWVGRTEVAHGWQDVDQVFSAGDGVIYAVKHDGSLIWCRHLGYRDGTATWAAEKPVATGWSGLRWAFVQP